VRIIVNKTVLLYCDSDSQVFAGIEYVRAFVRHGWTATFAIPSSARLAANATLLIEQANVAVLPVERPQLAYAALEKAFTAIGIMTTGSAVKAVCEDIAVLSRLLSVPRPIVFTGFNGLVFEKFEEGMFWRLECDVIGLNGPRDKILFDQFMFGREAEAPRVVLTGLHRGKPGTRIERERPKMVFCEQIVVPGSKGDRNQLFTLLAGVAAANPDWDVVIKPRIARGEKSFHSLVSHPEPFFERFSLPNLQVNYAPLDEQLADAALVGTVSSTAVFDGLNHGVPFFCVGNFGVSNKYGTHVFVPSGVMVNLKASHSLDELRALKVSPAWLDWVGYSPAYTMDVLVEAVDDMVGKPRRPMFSALSELRHTNTLLQRTNRDVLAAKLNTEHKTREVGALLDYALAASVDAAHDKAIQALELAHGRAPAMPLIIRTLATLLSEAGQKDKAVELVAHGLQELPNNYSLQILHETLTGRRAPAHRRLLRFLHITARKRRWIKH
jgi:hypothetical protein